MKSDVISTPKKRAGRRYQFDPQDVSSKFHLIEERIRDIVVQDRAAQKQEYEVNRESRCSLFKQLSETRESFIPPESKDEADIRALAINSQIVIKNTMKDALRSLLSTIETARGSMTEPSSSPFSTECLTTEEEQAEERQVLEALRELRSSNFLSDLLERSRADKEARQQKLEEIMGSRCHRNEEEALEEDETLLASDRKLVTSGIYRNSNRP